MAFVPSSVSLPSGERPSYWFIYKRTRLLVKTIQKQIFIPTAKDISNWDIEPKKPLYIGALDGCPCYVAGLEENDGLAPGIGFHGLRELFGLLADHLWSVAGYGLHIIDWDRSHLYCSRCGASLEHKQDEQAKICRKCELVNYPRINPCIIVAVLKADKILLARSSRFPKRHIYSVLAGYVEPGETLESCVSREVKEEVNVDIKNISYFSSQPWPFSSSLMVAFTAEHAKGEIEIDGQEIIDAGWYAADALPEVPGPGSIAGRLIDWFKKRNQ